MSVYLEPELDLALGRLTTASGISKAEAIRRAVRVATADTSAPVVSSLGAGEGPGDVSGDVERHLKETGFGTS